MGAAPFLCKIPAQFHDTRMDATNSKDDDIPTPPVQVERRTIRACNTNADV